MTTLTRLRDMTELGALVPEDVPAMLREFEYASPAGGFVRYELRALDRVHVGDVVRVASTWCALVSLERMPNGGLRAAVVHPSGHVLVRFDSGYDVRTDYRWSDLERVAR